ncbi:ATP-grasp domain-containing protein [Janthinobacterium aquaticum]|uniref:ATP-grasp domain-containing protein n=1 Tax=Janthinobacterium sp. FT58W TaxID=2654254 RepID=UPI001264290B|nr:ATP-grasp domain-containing protein [Janthinobacterium sp. FT58W]KAB8044474.1 carbamoyl-phosphate synthase subunit L [Janthinobacterium sp. FT58W]
MKKILVSGASGIVGYGILRSLRKADPTLHLIGSSMYTDSVAPAFCDIFKLAPATSTSGYLNWLCATISRHQIDLIIPGIEIDLHSWSASLALIERHGARVVMNRPELVALCQDKWAFYTSLMAAGMPCIIDSSLDNSYEALVAAYGLPFLLKPRRGFGSKGIVRVDSAATFERHRHDIGLRLMAQPIVGNDDNEFTTSAFCDGNGGYHASITLRRKLSKDGFTDKAEVVDAAQFRETLERLCQHYLPIGPTNFQFRTCADGVKLLEINPRISSSTSIRTAFGYNESAMAVDFYLSGKIPTPPAIRRGHAVRYIEEHIFYDDRVHF